MMTETVTLRAPEVRTFAATEFRDATESGQYLEGRAVPYNVWADIGWFREQFVPGAFAKSIREAAKKLPLLLWHDNRTFPIGVSHEWRDNDDGLDVVWKLDVDDPRAVEAARKARDGLLTGLSIGFADRALGEDEGRTPARRQQRPRVGRHGRRIDYAEGGSAPGGVADADTGVCGRAGATGAVPGPPGNRAAAPFGRDGRLARVLGAGHPLTRSSAPSLSTR